MASTAAAERFAEFLDDDAPVEEPRRAEYGSRRRTCAQHWERHLTESWRGRNPAVKYGFIRTREPLTMQEKSEKARRDLRPHFFPLFGPRSKQKSFQKAVRKMDAFSGSQYLIMNCDPENGSIFRTAFWIDFGIFFWFCAVRFSNFGATGFLFCSTPPAPPAPSLWRSPWALPDGAAQGATSAPPAPRLCAYARNPCCTKFPSSKLQAPSSKLQIPSSKF